jgi:FkbM family methyltransferase
MEDALSVFRYLEDDDRGAVVQAGGHVGLWPSVLSHWFRKVYTFEPEPDNYQCLLHNNRHNIDSGKVDAFNSGLSSQSGWLELVYSQINTGGHHIGVTENDTDKEKLNVTLMTIDSLGLSDCTAIFLDVEGHELETLKGAEDTIDRFSPLLMLEAKDHTQKGGYRMEDMEQYLQYKKYVKVGERAHDSIYIRA